MNLYSINTGYFKLDGGAMFGVVPKSIWNKLYPADSNNMINMAMRSLLIEEGNRLILVDNGIGNKQDEKFFGHYYLHGEDSLEKSLARHGFTKDDITDVILTHLHFDHCGGSIIREGDKLVPAFRHATFWSQSRHWKWATEPNAREKASFLKENILPIKESGQLKFADVDRTSFPDFIKIREVYGHTDAMILPEVRYKGRTLVYMADLIPFAAQLPIPYIMAYDMFPLTTLQEKTSFLQEAAAGDFVLFFEHDAMNECCSLQLTEKGVRQKETFLLESL
jgi:glyoxylase-like metal-dependent hydrolase (beta-lactamase superfamily II)